MEKREKNISLFLMDGDATGRIKCTLANWTGVIYKIPRTKLDESKDREDLKQSGVYFLFGADLETDEESVYIGQAGSRKSGEGIYNRLQEHKRNVNKDYWSEAIVLTTSNNSLGPTEISYLENKFFKLATEVNRYEIKNSTEPNVANVTEEKESELAEFVENSKLIMGTLGYKVFESFSKTSMSNTKEEPMLYINSGDVNSMGRRVSEGFVVYANSKVKLEPSIKCKKIIKERREKNKNKIENGILKEDILFKTPSAAASFVMFYSSNGFKTWKDDKGRTLKEIENK